MLKDWRGNETAIDLNDDYFDMLVKKGNMLINDLISPAALTTANNLLIEQLDIRELKAKKLPGFKMGNLAIKSCTVHNQLWQLLKDSGLIESLGKRFKNYKYVSFGGNLNLPNSKKQRLHIDTTASILTINIPLIDVTEQNGAVSVIDTEFAKPHSTMDILKKQLYLKSNRVCSQQGDVILRFASTWHKGNENNSQQPRIMLSFTLRENWPWPQTDPKESHLIWEKFETKPIEFSGNIYPESKVGVLLENLDYYLPSLSFNMLHIRNIFKGH